MPERAPQPIILEGLDSPLSTRLIQVAEQRPEHVKIVAAIAGPTDDYTEAQFRRHVTHDSVYGRLSSEPDFAFAAKDDVSEINPRTEGVVTISSGSSAKAFRDRFGVTDPGSLIVVDQRLWSPRTEADRPETVVSGLLPAGFQSTERRPRALVAARLQALLPIVQRFDERYEVSSAIAVHASSYDGLQGLHDRAGRAGSAFAASRSATQGMLALDPHGAWESTAPELTAKFFGMRLLERMSSVPMSAGARIELAMHLDRKVAGLDDAFSVLQGLENTHALEQAAIVSTADVVGRPESGVVGRESVLLWGDLLAMTVDYDPLTAQAHRMLDLAVQSSKSASR